MGGEITPSHGRCLLVMFTCGQLWDAPTALPPAKKATLALGKGRTPFLQREM